MALSENDTIADSPIINRSRTFVDEQTGRTIRQLTDFPNGAHLGYFRTFRQLPDGRMLAWSRREHGRGAIILDPDSGDIELLPHSFQTLKLREEDGRNYYIRYKDMDAWRKWREERRKHRNAERPTGMQLWHIDLPGGEPTFDADIPENLPGHVEDITIDGKHLILGKVEQDLTGYPIPTTKDVEAINHYFSRPRKGNMWVYRIADGKTWQIFESEGMCHSHVDTSPSDTELIRFCMDMPDAQGQRVWSIRLDGSDRHPIRKQEFGEMITHEFWWSDPDYIGFTYQDRRNDPTLRTHHWAEYSYALTRLGIANLAGEQVYLSDPLNSYHSHIYRSNSGKLVSGEGTDGHSFVYAARFDIGNPKIVMAPLATIHTTYVPFRGQGVDCNFSANDRWLIYADKPDPEGPHQLFAVEVDL